ncbi:mediator of RNA polymerase II transcription subunit 8-A-like isoform X2 [Rhopilema esculentum]|uniref:mediator of RNA polymerase II transcription subunit 8-A-like isoform X2 n=1 Tax=Rhopilema esculentum TaxID=499914 RepID=UPI0031E14A5D|eukprot:gene4625-20899_t
MGEKLQEERQLETTIDMLITRVQDLKTTLTSFLFKLEHENPNWPQMLDSFAVLSGQINTLNKMIKGERIPILRNLVLFPIMVSLDRDESLEKGTEGRIQSFSHEVVPDALRTKYEPDVEKEEARFAKNAADLSPEEAQRQISTLNELTSHIVDMISTAREEWDSENTSKKIAITPSANDTNILLNAISSGTGLRRRPSVSVESGPTSDQKANTAALHNKAQSSMKANVRSHPYAGHQAPRGQQK